MKLFYLGLVFGLLLWNCEKGGLEDSQGEDCTVDYDCSGSLVCITGECVEPESMNATRNADSGTCRVDVDCDDNLICVGGLCVSNEEISGPGGLCKADKECKGDRICLDGHCAYAIDPDITGDGCSVDTECKDGRVCINGQCHYPSTGNADGGTAGNESNAGDSGTDGSLGSVCGNGVVEAGEHCDGDNLNGHTCASLGMGGGTLLCSAACLFDASLCESMNAGYGDGSIGDGGMSTY